MTAKKKEKKQPSPSPSHTKKLIPGPPPDFDDDAFLADDEPLAPEEVAEIEERIHRAVEPLPSDGSELPDIISGDVLRTGSLNIFSGPTHSGKSTLLAYLLSQISKGQPLFGWETRCPAVIAYVALDHCWKVYAPLYRKVGLEVVHYARRDDSEKGVARKLRNIIEQKGTYYGMEYLMLKLFPDGVPRDALVICDPIHPLTGKDINDHARVGEAMTDIGQYCGHRMVTIIGTAHTAKVQADPKKRYARAIDRAAGSTAIVGYAETAFALVTPHEIGDGRGRVSELHCDSRNAPPKVISLVRSATTGMFVTPEEASKEDIVTQTQDEVSAAMLLQFFPAPDTSISTGDVLKASAHLQLPKRTVERYLTTLYTGGQIEKMRKGVYRRREQRQQKQMVN